ncbi:MAG: orotate phosphoribosyltransferase [Chlamydiae bacterium]|nr:orotate phosphoribosyltransferase [Chlamydiota bacterium]
MMKSSLALVAALSLTSQVMADNGKVLVNSKGYLTVIENDPKPMMMLQKLKSDLAIRLHEIGAIKFGDFTLKSGLKSPIYADLRLLISYPDVMIAVAQLMNQAASSADFTHICGVPMGAIPIASIMSAQNIKPLLLVRPEAKEHGTKKMVEGAFKAGDCCLVIEDVATTGGSVLKTIDELTKAGIVVQDVAVIVNRQQGATKNLREKGYNLHSVFTMSEILDILGNSGKIDERTVQNVKDYLRANSSEL